MECIIENFEFDYNDSGNEINISAEEFDNIMQFPSMNHQDNVENMYYKYPVSPKKIIAGAGNPPQVQQAAPCRACQSKVQTAVQPAGQRAAQQTAQRAVQPSAQRAVPPTAQRTVQPKAQPTVQRSRQPTAQSKVQSRVQQSAQPTIQVRAQPTYEVVAPPAVHLTIPAKSHVTRENYHSSVPTKSSCNLANTVKSNDQESTQAKPIHNTISAAQSTNPATVRAKHPAPRANAAKPTSQNIAPAYVRSPGNYLYHPQAIILNAPKYMPMNQPEAIMNNGQYYSQMMPPKYMIRPIYVRLVNPFQGNYMVKRMAVNPPTLSSPTHHATMQ